MTHKETSIYTIVSTVGACAMLFACWGEEGWVFNAGILYAGMVFGHLLTEAMNEGE
jgi:hypothetical protein